MSADSINRNEFLSLLFHNHHGWLAAWLRKKTGCPHRAADLAQEAFARILMLPDPRRLEQPRAFMVTTATRIIIDEQRRRMLEQSYLEALYRLHGDDPLCADSPEQIMLAVQALQAIDSMLGGLAAKPRRAFLLSRLDGLGHAEIAAELGVSASMVKQYLASALGHCYRVLYPAAA
ncbi:sigma-70 family RNA polymerase sigma factor [Janthinobacterium agaricidamnosum]|uniref:RNA polymerase sigma factor, sigma-70 family protein n=1 Tax=Janthinobacterium agaricidamnosum NBRC 102515 = DSM 9628 TaxID=1349767 RepID=W0V9N1_9BURK|nr:sigma-70 family RNA polymerase sigma factor [Janthinobacterium agaricidamnosum]CDG84053.1 RNA polymerase sigma factor, sigma-70 family protein [Janthinobacterium agaricidamnosum NBRC 102515 = DSM 9628]